MALVHKHSYIMASSLLFVATLVVAFSRTNATTDLIGSICRKAQRPATCTRALRSDPRTKSADLNTLAAIAIDVSTKHAKTSHALVQSLITRAKNPKSKSRYSSCLDNYQDSIDSLQRCLDFLKNKDYGSLDSYASGALDFPETCDNDFEEAAARESGKLKAASVKLQDLCDVILIISSKLSGRVVE
ncbi:hypothetical protein DM860_002579 [Cuscuta australis]|uniref:Pectinesterase inhibitor domain-containing protein n=1 Tax=Cuscuta australis TaxID=267555 RepID=A0A328D2G2_9ASTE|nr:hypothetical protein DM860_002579 [Cuscuta australis]